MRKREMFGRRSTLLVLAGFLAALGSAAHGWYLSLDFEVGSNWQEIGWINPALHIYAESLDELVYADISDDTWPFKSDTGIENPNWEHFISGRVAAVSPFDNTAVFELTMPASRFSTGYSSWFPFVVEAYDSSGAMLARVTGSPNSRYWNGTGLSYLSVSLASPAITRLRLYADQGNFAEPGWWVIDNVSLDDQVAVPDIPEWPSLALAATVAPVILRVGSVKTGTRGRQRRSIP
ncbi:MAG: hypothetical protein ACPL7K_10350 [Armatimonadota bacterium]